MSTVAAKPQVEILGFEGCPNLAPTRALVERVARALTLEPVVKVIDVADADMAAKLRFLGSPSVRVNGVDVEPDASERSEHAFSCRVYRTPGGFVGQPTEQWLRAALVRATSAGGDAR